LGLLFATLLLRGETDIRRDATVEAVQRVMPAVVNVATETVIQVHDPIEQLFRDFFDPYYRRRAPNTQHSLGSGVIIDEEGYVLTNFHVVNRASRVWVKLYDGREYECEKISETSLTDLALLKIKTKKDEKFSAVKFAEDDDLLLGETVLALGNPFGLGGSVTRGILSSKSRRPATENEPLDVMDWLQTDASINPGNSGGALINLRGELIGINVAMYREGQGIGFAIPVKRIAAAMADIYSPEELESLWFGARVRPGTTPLQVMSVQLESPAGKAGLRAGDLILQVNGKPPRSFMEFIRQLRDTKDREDLVLSIQRGNEKRKLTMHLQPEKDFFNAELIRKKTGATLQEMTPELAEGLGMNWRGLLVSGVDRGSAAAEAELQRGMVITGIDGQGIADIRTAAKRLYTKAKGDKVIMDIVMPRHRGAYVQYFQGRAELTIR
ncbi:MAG TPA: trypsin-like peptidase domain-containing protein, partial [Verrucomicrobiae bacterium]|nr:trypsin-like peptidase domain-containing protein [Verrucomicrobiae bacterium]